MSIHLIILYCVIFILLLVILAMSAYIYVIGKALGLLNLKLDSYKKTIERSELENRSKEGIVD